MSPMDPDSHNIDIEAKYQRRLLDMTPAERFERMHALLHWVRDLYARQLQEQLGAVSPERPKWEVALRMYGSDPRTRALIEPKLQDDST